MQTPPDSAFDLAELWLSSCRAQGRSPRTIITYEDAVKKFRARRNSTPASGEGLETLTKLEARAFVRMLLETYTPGWCRLPGALDQAVLQLVDR